MARKVIGGGVGIVGGAVENGSGSSGTSGTAPQPPLSDRDKVRQLMLQRATAENGTTRSRTINGFSIPATAKIPESAKTNTKENTLLSSTTPHEKMATGSGGSQRFSHTTRSATPASLYSEFQAPSGQKSAFVSDGRPTSGAQASGTQSASAAVPPSPKFKFAFEKNLPKFSNVPTAPLSSTLTSASASSSSSSSGTPSLSRPTTPVTPSRLSNTATSSTLTEGVVTYLVGEYGDAWENQDTSMIPRIFTDDAVYHERPGKHMIGRKAILKYWKKQICEGQKDVTFCHVREDMDLVSGPTSWKKPPRAHVKWLADFSSRRDRGKRVRFVQRATLEFKKVKEHSDAEGCWKICRLEEHMEQITCSGRPAEDLKLLEESEFKGEPSAIPVDVCGRAIVRLGGLPLGAGVANVPELQAACPYPLRLNTFIDRVVKKRKAGVGNGGSPMNGKFGNSGKFGNANSNFSKPNSSASKPNSAASSKESNPAYGKFAKNPTYSKYTWGQKKSSSDGSKRPGILPKSQRSISTIKSGEKENDRKKAEGGGVYSSFSGSIGSNQKYFPVKNHPNWVWARSTGKGHELSKGKIYYKNMKTTETRWEHPGGINDEVGGTDSHIKSNSSSSTGANTGDDGGVNGGENTPPDELVDDPFANNDEDSDGDFNGGPGGFDNEKSFQGFDGPDLGGMEDFNNNDDMDSHDRFSDGDHYAPDDDNMDNSVLSDSDNMNDLSYLQNLCNGNESDNHIENLCGEVTPALSDLASNGGAVTVSRDGDGAVSIDGAVSVVGDGDGDGGAISLGGSNGVMTVEGDGYGTVDGACSGDGHGNPFSDEGY